MISYIVAFLFFIGAIALMLFALQFSQYKKRPSGCCGGGHCATGYVGETKFHSCYSEKSEFVDNYDTITKS
ncbi:MAG: hypothetical protein P8048_14775 [Calditrichia bacterium]